MKPGKGSLKSVREKKHERSPDFKGSLKLSRAVAEGEEIEIVGWMTQYEWGTRIGLQQQEPWTPDRAPMERRENDTKRPFAREIRDDDIPF